MPDSFAEWTRAFINELPDSSFLYIAPGGEKDEFDKTVPRSLRKFPYKDSTGKVDLPHLRNAIQRIPQSDAPGLTPEKMRSIQEKARQILDAQKAEAAEDGDYGDEAPGDDESPEGPEMEGSRPEEDRPAPPAFSEWCAPVSLADGQGRWVELVRSGSHFGRGSDRRVDLSPSDIQSMARGYQKIMSERWFATGAPVGYNHATIGGAVDPESTKAAGRIMDVRIEDNGSGVSLMGLIQWTDEARRRIQAGEFDGFSIEAIPASSARSKTTGELLGEWALVGGTLTNEPFVAGLSRVAASEKRNNSMSLTKLLSDTLSLGEGASDAKVLARVQTLSEIAAKAEALSEALADVTTDRDTIKADLEVLQAKETERMRDRACEDGRIASSERDRYLRIFVACGEDEASHAYPKGRIPTHAIGATGTEAERCNPVSVTAEVDALAEKLSSENGLDAVEAYGRAMQIVLSDPSKNAAYEAESLN